jgi:hypothetical protein
MSDEQIICAKCHAVNPADGHRCVECQAHLYVRCYHCRERNQRGSRFCTSCGKAMQATILWRLKHSFRDGETPRIIWLGPATILFVILIIAAAFYLTPTPKPPARVKVVLTPIVSNTPPVQAPFPNR